MVRWLAHCFRGLHERTRVVSSPASASATEPGAEERRISARNTPPTEHARQDGLLASMLDTDQFPELEHNDVSTVTSLEDARQLILKLKARVRELEGSAGQNGDSTLTSLRQIRLQEQEPRNGAPLALLGRGNDHPMPVADGARNTTEARADPKSVPHFFCAYNKVELVDMLTKAGKPAAAVLLQAVCEEDLGSLPPALLLDVDPAVSDAVAAAPELLAFLKNGGGALDFSQLVSMERLPNYLRLRLYMMQACGARPMLAYATASARSLFKVRTDRQMQYVLEGQVQQDAMLAMLLQEMLDEMLSAPVSRLSADSNALHDGGGDCSSVALHSMNHFVNTSNPKVFPFVPVTMRGCGYRKSSGEVVPCIIFEFSPDSNQGAFLEHLQRDYTMMGHISAIITLFTLKGDVLHQNAGSIAYYGFQRRSALDRSGGKLRGSGHGSRNPKRPEDALTAPDFDGSAGSWLQQSEPPVLTKLFQYAPPDALDGMLESMLQGGVWRSILPVPTTLATANRPLAASSPGDLLIAPGGAPAAAAFMGPDPDNMFTIDGVGFDLSQPCGDASIGARATAFDGSFALGNAGGGDGGVNSSRVHMAANGHGVVRSICALNAVPEQSQEHERTSFGQRPLLAGAMLIAAGTGAAAPQPQQPFQRQQTCPLDLPASPASSAKDLRFSQCSGRSSSTAIADACSATAKSAKSSKVPRRSTTFSTAPYITSTGPNRADTVARSASGVSVPGFLNQLAAGSGAGGCASSSFTTGGGSSRLSRIGRRSGLALGLALDGSPAEALSQSTWGLFGAAAVYEGRMGTGKDAPAGGSGDAERGSDVRFSAGRRFEYAVQARLAVGKALGLSAATAASTAVAVGPAAVAAATAAATAAAAAAAASPALAPPVAHERPAAGAPCSANGCIPSAVFAVRRSELASASFLSPSTGSAVDQWQQWQYRHSQWQEALQSQTSIHGGGGNGATATTTQSSTARQSAHAHALPHNSAAWLLHQHQHAGFSQSSSSAAAQSNQSFASNRRGGGGVFATVLLEGGGGGGSGVESLIARRHRAMGLGDGSMLSPASGVSTPTPSAGSLISPQPSAHQHPDSNFGGCTSFVASAGTVPLAAPHPPPQRPSPSYGPGQPSRFLTAASPGGSPVTAATAATPTGGGAGSPAAAAAARPSPLQSTASSGAEPPTRVDLKRMLSGPVTMAGGAGGGTENGSAAGSTSLRRAPMRQSERSNPSLVLPRPGSGSAGTTTIKSATSFSFGSKPGHLQRPLARMMSFLNSPPGAAAAAAAQHAHAHHSIPTSNSYSLLSGALIRGGSGPKRPASGQFLTLVEPVLRTGSGRGVPAGDGSMGVVRGSSQSGARFSTSAFLGSSNLGAVRRHSARRASSVALIGAAAASSAAGLQTASDAMYESSSQAALTTATLGTSREAAASAAGMADGGGAAGADRDGGGGGGSAPCHETYHEVTATPFLDPVSKSQVVMVVQTDVTARVQLERRLADVMEAEHKLLENIFPRHVLEHIARSAAVNQERASQFNLRMLSAMPDLTKTATDHERVTILFADIVGFTSMCKEVPAKAVMKFLNDLYTRFDTLLDIYGVYKVETIGDCYMVAGGLISKDADGFAAVRKDSCDNLQAWRVLSFAKAMLRDAQKVMLPSTLEPVKLRVGIHTGPVVSGVVGTRMPRFCLFGDTINTASRMESTCPYGRIQVSAATHALVPGEDWEATGGVQVKGKGVMETYLLKQPPPLALPSTLASACMSTPGLPDGISLAYGLGRMSRPGFAWLQGGGGGGSADGGGGGVGNVTIGGGAGSVAGGGGGLSRRGSVVGNISQGPPVQQHGGVLSAVTEKIPAAQAAAVSPGATRDGAGGSARGKRVGSSSGKDPSFLFNTVW